MTQGRSSGGLSFEHLLSGILTQDHLLLNPAQFLKSIFRDNFERDFTFVVGVSMLVIRLLVLILMSMLKSTLINKRLIEFKHRMPLAMLLA